MKGPCSSRATVRPAFTLIELLVTASIIALLLSVMLPALRRSRQAARELLCQSNLREWAAAVGLFAHENGGTLPRRGQGVQPATQIDRPQDWFNALPPLLDAASYRSLAAAGRVPRPGQSGLWVCPRAIPATGPHFFGYAMNMWLSTWFTPRPDRIDAVAPPSVQVFMVDSPGPYCSVVPAVQAYSAVARHDESVNVAFLDGHVAGFRGDYVGCGVGDPKRSDVRWVVPGSAWPGPGS